MTTCVYIYTHALASRLSCGICNFCVSELTDLPATYEALQTGRAADELKAPARRTFSHLRYWIHPGSLLLVGELLLTLCSVLLNQ